MRMKRRFTSKQLTILIFKITNDCYAIARELPENEN